MLELITIYNIGESYYLGKVMLNPNHISFVREHTEYSKILQEGKMNLELNKEVRFSEVMLSDNSGFNRFIVVGSPDEIRNKLNLNKRTLLRD